MGSKGVTESMGADGFLQSGLFCQLLDDVEYHDAWNGFPEAADKYKIFISGVYQSFVAVWKVQFQFVYGTWRNGDQALFASFTFYFDKFLFQVEVG